MSAKSIAAGFACVICGGVLLMPLLVQPDPVSARVRPMVQAIAGILPYEDCGLSARAGTASGISAAVAPDDRRERPCPREPVRLAHQAGTTAR